MELVIELSARNIRHDGGPFGAAVFERRRILIDEPVLRKRLARPDKVRAIVPILSGYFVTISVPFSRDKMGDSQQQIAYFISR